MSRSFSDAVQDSSVIRRAAAGDRSAREELFRRFGDRLHQIARRMLRCNPRLRQREETDDVMQQAALRLHRCLQDARPQHVRELFGLAVVQIQRVLIDLARHHFGRQGAGAHEQQLAAERAPDAAAPALAPETIEAWAAFHEQVASLPDDEREAFGMIWYGGATQAEAAELLGVSERTILRRVHKARLRLANDLSQHADELRWGRHS